MSKLYIVRIEVEAFVLADSEQDACGQSRDVLRDLRVDDFATAAEWSPGDRVPAGWKDGDLVYHDGHEDITAAQAMSDAQARDKEGV